MKKQVKGLFELFSEKRLTTVAGAWVYYFLMSVIPLAFLLATAFGVFGIDILFDLVSRLPEEFRQAGVAIAETAEHASKSVTLLFIITVIFSCTTLLNQMSKDGDFIYGVKAEKKRGVLRRVWAIVALGALFTVFLCMAFLFAFRVKIVTKGINGNVKLFLAVLAFSLIILFCYAIIIVLYKFISPVKQKLGSLFLGGLVSLSTIVVGTLGLSLYLRFFNSYNAFYGSLAGIVVFLIWAYIVMVGLVIGAIINKRSYDLTLSTEKVKPKKVATKPKLKRA
ncbi:MAG: YihY/virulence factor BrkB family protein [Clostridia bacterium]|nr:YihY/virulence factor BrkB family protein [Clostridia bacterium]